MTVSHSTVWLELDLRDAQWVPTSSAEYLEFWERNVGQLKGELHPDQVFQLGDRLAGAFKVRVTQVPKGFERATVTTPFAIHSVLEPMRVELACSCCARLGRPARHAPLFCYTCAELERAESSAPALDSGQSSRWLCVSHAVLLDGSLRAFCPEHAPTCACKVPARAFCFGPSCKKRSGVAFCEEHLRRHPNLANVQFCQACYDELFPACQVEGCASVATIRCSHWHRDTGIACGRLYCAEHAWRWQVYGRGGAGLARCEEHADLKQLTNEGLILQLAAGALLERRYRLPTLQAVTHILMKPRRERYAIAEVNRLFAQSRGELDAKRPFESRMLELINAHEASRQEDLKRDADEKAVGMPFFEKLRAELERRGLRELSESVQFSDYRPRDNRLYIYLDEGLRGWFCGAHHERIHDLSQTIGAQISFEGEVR
jgi:hypothetical protein